MISACFGHARLAALSLEVEGQVRQRCRDAGVKLPEGLAPNSQRAAIERFGFAKLALIFKIDRHQIVSLRNQRIVLSEQFQTQRQGFLQERCSLGVAALRPDCRGQTIERGGERRIRCRQGPSGGKNRAVSALRIRVFPLILQFDRDILVGPQHRLRIRRTERACGDQRAPIRRLGLAEPALLVKGNAKGGQRYEVSSGGILRAAGHAGAGECLNLRPVLRPDGLFQRIAGSALGRAGCA